MNNSTLTESEEFIINNVKATLRFEDMYPTEEEVLYWIKIMRGELDINEYLTEIIERYKK